MSLTKHVQQDIPSTEEEKQNKQECLINQYKNTPFALVQTDEGYFLAIGSSRLSPVFKNEDNLDEWVENNLWNLIGGFTLWLLNNKEVVNNNEQLN
jgi:hypothetical protein